MLHTSFFTPSSPPPSCPPPSLSLSPLPSFSPSHPHSIPLYSTTSLPKRYTFKLSYALHVLHSLLPPLPLCLSLWREKNQSPIRYIQTIYASYFLLYLLLPPPLSLSLPSLLFISNSSVVPLERNPSLNLKEVPLCLVLHSILPPFPLPFSLCLLFSLSLPSTLLVSSSSLVPQKKEPVTKDTVKCNLPTLMLQSFILYSVPSLSFSSPSHLPSLAICVQFLYSTTRKEPSVTKDTFKHVT